MKNLIPLMQREWLQHRFAWALLMLVPFALAVMLLSFGQIEMNTDFAARSGADLAAMLGMLSVTLSMAVLFLLVWVVSLFVTSLAFESAALQEQAKIGVFAASLVAGLAGYALLRWGENRAAPAPG